MKEPEVDISALIKARTAFYLDKRSVLSELRYAPNIISLFRIILIIPICLYYADPAPAAHWTAFALLVVSYVSDYADGVVARRFGQQSALGLILDPLADKIWTTVMLILLMRYRELPIWLGVSIASRDFILITLNSRVMRHTGIVMASDWLGKSYMLALGLLIIVMTLRFEWSMIFAYLMLPFTLLSLLNYTIRYRSAMRMKPAPQTAQN